MEGGEKKNMTKIFDLNKIVTFSQKKGVLSIPEDLVNVKKDLLTTKSCTIALICFETGQEIPAHPEPYAACFYVISGKGLFTVGKKQFE